MATEPGQTQTQTYIWLLNPPDLPYTCTHTLSKYLVLTAVTSMQRFFQLYEFGNTWQPSLTNNVGASN